ncbi:TPA: P-loop NTPase fold protein [Vibrio fluvialis]
MNVKKINQWDTEVTTLGETLPADKLGRAKHAAFLTSFLVAQGYDETKEIEDQKKNYVLNLNSDWGSGKTYFLKRWYHDLKSLHPVVYVDAWRQDYSDDPLMTVISSMITQLRDQAGKKEDDAKFKVPRKAIGLLKAALPNIVGTLGKRYLGIDPVAIMQAPNEGDLNIAIEDDTGNKIDMGAAASKIVQYLLEEHDAKNSAIESLKKSVEQWIEAVVALDNRQYPAFVFIDELDRCRPNYAVEMLETIKHIFDIPGVVFVVGTDTEQLQHTVRAIYGEGFDARRYLGRFFNSRCTLKKPSFKELLATHCDMHKLTSTYFRYKSIDIFPQTLDSIEHLNSEVEIPFRNMTKIFEAFNLQPRQVIQITNRIISIVDNVQSGVLVDMVFLTTLLCIKEISPEIYLKIMENYNELVAITTNSDIVNFFYHRTKVQDVYVILKLNPTNEVPSFIEKQLRHRNNWRDGYYSCSLLLYIQKVINIIANKNKINSIIESETMEAFNIQRRNSISQNKGHVWLSIEFANKQKVNGQSLDFYNNLVELSSALDSIELNE